MITVIIIIRLLVHYSPRPTTSVLVEERPIVIAGQLSANCLRGKGTTGDLCTTQISTITSVCNIIVIIVTITTTIILIIVIISSINSHYQKKRGTMLL